MLTEHVEAFDKLEVFRHNKLEFEEEHPKSSSVADLIINNLIDLDFSSLVPLMKTNVYKTFNFIEFKLN